jgi:hypothetical protein
MARQDPALQESQAGDAMKNRHACGTLSQGLLVRLPGLQGPAGYVKPLGRWALGHPLGLAIAIARTLLRACEAIPALDALLIVPLLGVDSCAPSSRPLRKPLSRYNSMAQDGEVACLWQPLTMSSHSLSGAVSETKWPTR